MALGMYDFLLVISSAYVSVLRSACDLEQSFSVTTKVLLYHTHGFIFISEHNTANKKACIP